MSANKIIARIAGIDIFWDGEAMSWLGGFQVDVDGAPGAYSALSSKAGLDSWTSACYPDGNYKDILVCDAHGKPVVQDGQSPAQPQKDFFIAATSYQHREFVKDDVRRYVDATKVPYGVINGRIKKLVPPKFIGCYGELKNLRNGRTFQFVCADVGPTQGTGEGSLNLVHTAGFPNASARNGIDEKIFKWTFYPGRPAVINGVTYQLQ